MSNDIILNKLRQLVGQKYAYSTSSMLLYTMTGVSQASHIVDAATPRDGGYIADWIFSSNGFFAMGIVPGATAYAASNTLWAILYSDENDYPLTPSYFQATSVKRMIPTSPYNCFYSAERDPRYDSPFYVSLEVPTIRASKFGKVPYRTTRRIDLWNTAGEQIHKFYVTCDEDGTVIDAKYVRP